MPDSHEFTVKIFDDSEVETAAFRVRNITEINDNLECGDIAVTLSQVMDELPVAENNQPQVSSSSKDRKRSHSENSENAVENENQDEPKKPKIEPVEPPPPADELPAACSSTSLAIIATIKPDPDSTNSTDQSNSIMPSVSLSNVKQEPDSSSVKTEPNNDPPQQQPNLRRSCDFGVRCFRHTPEHRREFAHPGDADYRRPAFPSAVPNSPRCPYWESCYRRNPDHFRMFEHPSSCKSLNSRLQA